MIELNVRRLSDNRIAFRRNKPNVSGHAFRFLALWFNPRKRAALFQAVLILIFGGSLLFWNSKEVSGKGTGKTGIITISKLHMRSAPDINASSVKILYKGTKVEIKHIGKWLEISHEDQTGYIRNREIYVSIVTVQEKEPAEESVLKEKSEQQAEQLMIKSKSIGREIEKHRAEVLTFTRQETALVGSLDEVDLSIDKLRRKITEFKAELVGIEKQIESNTKASHKLLNEINSNETYISKRLISIYKLNWFGKIHVLASAESMYDLFQRKAGLERILRYDENVRRQLVSNKTRLEKVRSHLDAQKKEKLIIESKHHQQIKTMTYEKARRSKLLAEIRSKKTLELAAIDLLIKAARALDQKIKTLHIEKDTPKKFKKILERSFVKLKGLLKMPVKGKIVTHFGLFKNTKFNVENFRSGIDIKADRGEPVHAVSTGKILYASWFKGYGNMIIIDHGNNYYTVYAHIEETFKTKGDCVDAHEVIATVGDTASMKGSGLYFEVRHRGKPLNPLDWIKKG